MPDDVTVRVESRGEPTRALCHDAIGTGAIETCAGCQVTLHVDCARDVSECPTSGCRRQHRQQHFVKVKEPSTAQQGNTVPGEDDEGRPPVWQQNIVVALAVVLPAIPVVVAAFEAGEVFGLLAVAVLAIAVVFVTTGRSDSW